MQRSQHLKKTSTSKSSKPKAAPSFLGPAPEHRIILAFNQDGEDYFEFDEDVFFLPFRRGLMASAFFKELQQGVDREYLLWYTSEMKKIFSDTKQLNLSRAAILNHQLSERLEFIFEPDLIYKLASVVYFDKSENPYNYNLAYGYKKIARWKQNEKVEDFFLRQPIKKLIPFFKGQEQNILNYLQVAQKIKEQHTANLSPILSKASSILQSQQPSL